MNGKAIARHLTEFVRSIYGTEEFIPLHAPRFEGNEEKYVLDAIQSGFVSTVGVHVQEFERRIAEFTGAKHAVATVNGTAALHAAMLVGGVNRGDEVITQAVTFVATCNAIRYCGADPVFVDVSRRTLGMCPESLAELLETHAEVRDDGLCWNRTTGRVMRACVPMHNFGHPVEIDAIKEICDRWRITLIEDAAESLGSFYRGRHTGLVGTHAAISFNGNKIITTGGGGMIITDDDEVARKARHITTTAKRPHAWLYIHDELGYNYRLPALNAALGCAQAEVLPEFVARKRALAERYAAWFEAQEYQFMLEPNDARSNYWINAFFVSDREERDCVLEYTNASGVMTRPIWTPMHTLDMFSDCLRADLPNTEWLDDRLVNVPSSVV